MGSLLFDKNSAYEVFVEKFDYISYFRVTFLIYRNMELSPISRQVTIVTS